MWNCFSQSKTVDQCRKNNFYRGNLHIANKDLFLPWMSTSKASHQSTVTTTISCRDEDMI